MIRRLLGSVADVFLNIQRACFPITIWMPRFYRVQPLINWEAKHTLDASCGTGDLTVWMAKRGIRVSGTNLSEHEIEQARQLAGQEKADIDFQVGDLSARTPFDTESFDQIVSLDTVVHIPNDDNVFLEFHRLLAPQGTLIISLATIAPSGQGNLFKGETLFRKLIPRVAQTAPIWENKRWLELSPEQQQARFYQCRFYNLQDFQNQVSDLFELVHYEYALHKFTVWATDLVFGVKFFRFLEPTLFTLATKLDNLFYNPDRPGYLLFAVLKKK